MKQYLFVATIIALLLGGCDVPDRSALDAETAGTQSGEILIPTPVAPSRDVRDRRQLLAARSLFGVQGDIPEYLPLVEIERASVLAPNPHPSIPVGFVTVLRNGEARDMTVAVYTALYGTDNALEEDWIQQVTVPANIRWDRRLIGPAPMTVGTKFVIMGIAAVDEGGGLVPLDLWNFEPLRITPRPGAPRAAEDVATTDEVAVETALVAPGVEALPQP